jgi:hypothetical protein
LLTPGELDIGALNEHATLEILGLIHGLNVNGSPIYFSDPVNRAAYLA